MWHFSLAFSYRLPYCQPPEGGRLFDMKVKSSCAFCGAIMNIYQYFNQILCWFNALCSERACGERDQLWTIYFNKNVKYISEINSIVFLCIFIVFKNSRLVYTICPYVCEWIFYVLQTLDFFFFNIFFAEKNKWFAANLLMFVSIFFLIWCNIIPAITGCDKLYINFFTCVTKFAKMG